MKLPNSRQIMMLLVLLLGLPGLVQAQYRKEVPHIPGITLQKTNGNASVLGIDLSKIEFQNSYSMDVSSFGGNTVAMGLLKSSFNYVINPQVSVKGYVGLAHSPFSSLSPAHQQASFMDGISKENVIYGGEITYRPTENTYLQIGFNRLPADPRTQLYNPYYFRNLGY